MTLGRTPGYRRWAGMPIMVCYFDFFGHLFVIFRDFRHFFCVWIHLEALGIQENTGGVGWYVWPSTMVCYFDFSAIFFYLFFVIFRDFLRFSCVWMRLEALGKQEATGGVG